MLQYTKKLEEKKKRSLTSLFGHLVFFHSGPYFKESLHTFVVGHWSVSRQVTTRLLSVTNDENVLLLEDVPSQCSSANPLPVEAYSWLVKHMSKEGDAVVDVGSNTGYVMMAALKEGRNSVGLSTASQHEQQTLKTRISTLLATEIQNVNL